MEGLSYRGPRDICRAAVDNATFAKNTIQQKHKTAYAYYDRKILSRINKEKEIETSMREALRNGEFVPYFQPKVDCYTGMAVGAEALVRWTKTDGEVILPSLFIPYFEKAASLPRWTCTSSGVCGS